MTFKFGLALVFINPSWLYWPLPNVLCANSADILLTPAVPFVVFSQLIRTTHAVGLAVLNQLTLVDPCRRIYSVSSIIGMVDPWRKVVVLIGLKQAHFLVDPCRAGELGWLPADYTWRHTLTHTALCVCVCVVWLKCVTWPTFVGGFFVTKQKKFVNVCENKLAPKKWNLYCNKIKSNAFLHLRSIYPS